MPTPRVAAGGDDDLVKGGDDDLVERVLRAVEDAVADLPPRR